MKFNFFWSPIKRSHLASILGPGSVVRAKNGITALVGGLSEWEAHVPGLSNLSQFDQMNQKERFLKQFKLRDPELESVLEVDYFISSQALSSSPDLARDWFIPMVRFPLAGVCSNNTCRRLTISEPDKAGITWCDHCTSVKHGKKIRRKILQLPFFLICSAGHIEEINWQELVHDNCTHNCQSSKIKLLSGINMHSLNARCMDCECGFVSNDLNFTCSGQHPWFKGTPRTDCILPLTLVDRTNVLIYQPWIRSSILMPPKDNLNFALIDWLRNRDGFKDFDVASEKNWQGLIDSISRLDFDVSSDEIKKHVIYALSGSDSENQDEKFENWRTREFEIMTSQADVNNKWEKKVLDHEVLILDSLEPKLFGNNGIFSSVSQINMLTETRVLAGFNRNAAEVVNLDTLKSLLWGQESRRQNWLPGYRGYGEGILFEINANLIADWVSNVKGDVEENRIKLSHTLAHLFISEAAISSGYSLASIRDRIFSLENGRLGFLIYTAEADEAGTLGGLVELSNLDNLENFVDSAIRAGRWCSQDPVCLVGSGNFQIDLQAGACHQCVLLPETSCEIFNKELDRALIFGCADRGIKGFLRSISA